jgi:hypothetical protein
MTNTHLNLFDSLVKGPSFVQSELAKLALDKGQQRHAPRYLVELTKKTVLSKKEEFLRPFVIGFLNSRASYSSDNALEKEKFLNDALQSYRAFLHKPKGALPDWLYYAQWQLAEIGELLCHNSNTVEERCLKAAEWDAIRAEALRHILLYRFKRAEWRIAYIYSSYCADQFLGKPPTQRNWFINQSFYDWKILKYHIQILLAIRKKQEAAIKLADLQGILQANPKKFSENDYLDIESLKNMI